MRLSRRTFLRGALAGSGVAIALPWLEASSGASVGPYPDRFGVWFFGNGTRPDRWVPPTTGFNWALSDELAPLSAVRGYVSPVTGHEIKTATHPHHAGMTGIMTGQAYHQLGTTRDTIVSTFARRSVDQDAAAWFAGQTPLHSLEVGVTGFWGTDEGTTFQHLSHNGPNSPNPSEYNPPRLFQRLFGGGSDPAVIAARKSVLDVVADQTLALNRHLGAADRSRMDQHLTSIRALETRLQSGTGVCGVIPAPTPIIDTLATEQIAERNAIQSQLLALALACDLTRAFSVQFSTCGSGVLFWQVGATDGMHLMCHTEAQPQPKVHAAVTFTMEQLATFLATLRDTPEGDGNLLDHSSILVTSELADGSIHSQNEFPILIAGGGNGRLRPGQHVRSTSLRNTSDAVLTALHGAGVDLPTWGVGPGLTSTPVSELLA